MFTSVILLKASTEQIPTYKQYKYLRPDPTEAEMAQATVNKEMDIKKLSEVASVTVTKQSDVKFMVIPKEEVLLETEVVFTRRNWIGFVTVGRPKILQAIRDQKDVKFLYHGNSKVAIVVHRDNGSYQVHFMTYSAKGSPRRDLCVYLTQEEYEALENHIPDINHAIELITLSTSSNKKPLLLCSYKWKIIPKNEHAVVPLCSVSYLDENHAMKCGMQTAADCDLDVDEVQIIADWLPVPQELAFLRKIYLIMMYKACKYCMHAHCNACKEWLSEDDPLHEEPNFGCQAKERNVISEYISEAKEYVDDAIVKNVFLNCWKKLELGFVNVDHLLNQIHMLYDEENGTSIIELVLKSMGNIKQDPEAMFIEDKLIEIKYREHVESFIPDIQDLSPIQDKKRPFGMDIGPNSEEEEVKKKKKKKIDELSESVSDLIKIDTKAEKKQEK